MILLMQPEVQAGETYDHGIGDIAAATSTFVGVESVTVPAGTFETLRMELVVHGDDNSCGYKTTFWLAKDIGPIKIHRTDANPVDCTGCVFVCVSDDDVTKLNTPAELGSAVIDGSIY